MRTVVHFLMRMLISNLAYYPKDLNHYPKGENPLPKRAIYYPKEISTTQKKFRLHTV